jgi:inorganic pyrophosphatase
MGDLSQLPASPQDGVLHVIVESPAGSTAKIKWEPSVGLFTLSRPSPLAMAYPHDGDFVPGTPAADGDPLDALVLTVGSSFPGSLLRCRAIGLVQLEQNRQQGNGRERNSKRLRRVIEQFFVDVTFFENKAAAVLGWGGPDEAWTLLQVSTSGGH